MDRPDAIVTAVEPDPAMLAELQARLPAVHALRGTAEEIPLPDASVDAVLVGQAMHWFDQERAMPEIARVLRPSGVLAGLWNGDDDSVDWIAGYHEAASFERPVAGVPGGGSEVVRLQLGTGGFAVEIAPSALFGDFEQTAFPHAQRLTVDGLIDVLATHSWALTSEPADRDAAFAHVRAYLATRPETSSGEFDLPLRTVVFRLRRVGAGSGSPV